MMTLAEFIFTYGILPMDHDGMPVRIDMGQACRRSAPHYHDVLWELFHLRDYVVSSSQGGWLYRLVPRS